MGSYTRVLVALAFVLLASACGEQDEQNPPLDPPASLRVLFVGNGFVADDEFRAHFYELAKTLSGNERVVTGLSRRSVYELPQDPESDPLESKLRSGDYSVVVVQGIGGWPDCAESARQCSYFESELRQISDLAAQHGAETIWMAMWHPDPRVETQFSEHVESIAERAGVRAVDAGRVLYSSEEFYPSSQLLTPNQQPKPVGSWYLAALLLAAVQDAPLSAPTSATLSTCGPRMVVSDVEITGTDGTDFGVVVRSSEDEFVPNTPREGNSTLITPTEFDSLLITGVSTCYDSLSEDRAALIVREVNAAMGFPQ
ncbi:MAG: hypothetical protein QNI99_12715 [Woeseiaceae bacterium]|nr:hypothetical protein [Woeseiaceae bacterium]